MRWTTPEFEEITFGNEISDIVNPDHDESDEEPVLPPLDGEGTRH